MANPTYPYSKEWMQSYLEDQWKKVCSMSDEELTQQLAKDLHMSPEQVDEWAKRLEGNVRMVLRNWLFRKRR